jgi:D-3-phosphoglycerate dehydrogenase
MKILANDGISPAGENKLKSYGYEVITNPVDQDELVEYINENDIRVLLVRSATKVRADLIDACPDLKMIGRGGVGLDNIDVDYAKSKGIEVINTPAASSQSVAELVMGSLFSMVRMTYDANRQMPVKGNTEFKLLKKKYAKGIELRGKTLGIIGTGRIGAATASYALGIGMKVIGYDAFMDKATVYVPLPDDTIMEVIMPMVSLEELYRSSDFITIHVPAQPGDKPLISNNELNIMKDGVYLVNASRGGLIDEHDLIAALDSGKVAGATLDVFLNEPTPKQELIAHTRLITTPHIGAATLEAQDRIGTELAEKINDYFG